MYVYGGIVGVIVAFVLLGMYVKSKKIDLAILTHFLLESMDYLTLAVFVLPFVLDYVEVQLLNEYAKDVFGDKESFYYSLLMCAVATTIMALACGRLVVKNIVEIQLYNLANLKKGHIVVLKEDKTILKSTVPFTNYTDKADSGLIGKGFTRMELVVIGMMFASYLAVCVYLIYQSYYIHFGHLAMVEDITRLEYENGKTRFVTNVLLVVVNFILTILSAFFDFEHTYKKKYNEFTKEYLEFLEKTNSPISAPQPSSPPTLPVPLPPSPPTLPPFTINTSLSNSLVITALSAKLGFKKKNSNTKALLDDFVLGYLGLEKDSSTGAFKKSNRSWTDRTISSVTSPVFLDMNTYVRSLSTLEADLLNILKDKTGLNPAEKTVIGNEANIESFFKTMKEYLENTANDISTLASINDFVDRAYPTSSNKTVWTKYLQLVFDAIDNKYTSNF